ncbi:MAG: helix-turn-helix domain-containing protein [Solirubrobacterales bacterium]
MDVAGKFGNNPARTRRLAGISQDELSIRASVHRTEISQLERGLRLARVDVIAKLCGSLEADPGELLAGINWQPGNIKRGRFKETPEASQSDA